MGRVSVAVKSEMPLRDGDWLNRDAGHISIVPRAGEGSGATSAEGAPIGRTSAPHFGKA